MAINAPLSPLVSECLVPHKTSRNLRSNATSTTTTTTPTSNIITYSESCKKRFWWIIIGVAVLVLLLLFLDAIDIDPVTGAVTVQPKIPFMKHVTRGSSGAALTRPPRTKAATTATAKSFGISGDSFLDKELENDDLVVENDP